MGEKDESLHFSFSHQSSRGFPRDALLRLLTNEFTCLIYRQEGYVVGNEETTKSRKQILVFIHYPRQTCRLIKHIVHTTAN